LLTPQDEHAIDVIISQLNPPTRKRVSIDYVLGKWEQVIQEVGGVYPFTLDDFSNDLGHRDFLERVKVACPPMLRRKLSDTVDEIDKKFYESTFEVDYPTHGSKQTFNKSEYPWRYRVPKRHRPKEFEGFSRPGFGNSTS
jgi:hypothetical protein